SIPAGLKALAEDGIASNVKLDTSPDIGQPPEFCGYKLSFNISPTSLRQQSRGIIIPEVNPQGIAHNHLHQIVMSGRHDPGGVAVGQRKRADAGTPPVDLVDRHLTELRLKRAACRDSSAM